MLKAIAVAVASLATVLPTCQSTPGNCNAYLPALIEHQPPGGWDAGRMSRYMYRESNCQPGVRSTTRDTGLLQINDVNLPYLSRVMGRPIYASTLRDPVTNIRAGAALCTYWRRAGRSCYAPWGG